MARIKGISETDANDDVRTIIEAQKLTEHLRQLAPGLRLSNLAETMPPLRRAEDRAKYTEGLREAGLPEQG